MTIENMMKKNLINRNNWRTLIAGSCLAAALLAVGCTGNKKPQATPDDLTPYYTTFKGTMPCAGDKAADATLELKEDHTYALSCIYKDAEQIPNVFVAESTWSYADSLFALVRPAEAAASIEDTLYLLARADGSLVVADRNKKANTAAALKPATLLSAKDFEGTFDQGTDEKGAYRQTLTLIAENDHTMHVKVEKTSGKGDGCTFEGTGRLLNDMVLVPLSSVDANLQAVLVVRLSSDKNTANVASTDFEQRYDLAFFCGGGGTLAGDYTRRTE